ncbi:MAG: 2-oxoacid:acceptor oxidoreductase family protein [Sedimentisphaerales bacterium]|nr:2-oxoacid:acceptor oxidoreductase family protein [Sedimentisphaerales bacterium]
MTTNGFCEEIIIAGFGGQGIILAGKLLAQTAMKAGREVTYMPSYGAEVRGGTANCMVIVSDKPIANPVVTRPCSLIAMNKASLTKFGPRIKAGGLLIMNSSLIDGEPELEGDIEIVAIPADDLAVELGSPRSANMVAMGAYLQKRGYLGPDAAAVCLADVLAKRHHETLPVNSKALHRGAEFAAQGS